jgi:dephospho-CoA kinase
MIVGITGSYCSGKSVACVLFQQHGYEAIDVDLIGHEVLEDKKQNIIEVFGEEILKEGHVDRGRLGFIVFNDHIKKQKLEDIVHPEMVSRVKEAIKNKRDVVINAALLIEMGLDTLCDFVIGVDVKEEVAIKRGMARDQLTSEEAALRLKAQIPLKEKLHCVDKVIDNNGAQKDFENIVRGLIQLLGQKE